MTHNGSSLAEGYAICEIDNLEPPDRTHTQARVNSPWQRLSYTV